MERFNIYINDEQINNITDISEIFDQSKAEVIREAVDDISIKYESELNKYRSSVDNSVGNILEIQKCKNSVVYFIENFIKVNTRDYGKRNFKLYDWQVKYLETVSDYDYLITNKSRQSGYSALTCAYIVHSLIFKTDTNIVFLCNNYRWGSETVNTIKDMIDSLPRFITGTHRIDGTKKRIIASGPNNKLIVTTDMEHVKNIDVNELIVDEMAYFKSFDAREIEQIMAFYDNRIKVFIGSTPNGYNHFYKLWVDALTNYNNLKAISIPWTSIPGRDGDWAEQMIQNIGIKKFNESFCCSFVGENNAIR